VPDTSLSELARRLSRLEAQTEIMRTLNAYTTAHYNGDLALYLDCFLPDGVQEHPGGIPPARGHAQLSSRFTRNAHAPESYHKIILIDPLIEIDGENAHVESDWVLVQGGRSVVYISVFGHYSDELVSQLDGRWRIRLRRVATEARTTDLPGTEGSPASS
jgi:hypothetical protein